MKLLQQSGHISHLVTAEAVWPGQPRHGNLIFEAGPEHVLWQKERLLNLAIASLPVDVHYVAWIDSDVVFSNPNWVEETLEALEGADIVQPFQEVEIGTSPHNETRIRRYGWVAAPADNTEWHSPGLAWAAHRSALPDGLYERCIVGSTDWAMALRWSGGGDVQEFTQKLRHDINRWSGPLRMGYIPGTVWHPYHGSLADRRYHERSEILQKHDYDPKTDVRVGSNSLLEFAGNKPALQRDVAAYFAGRNEKNSA